MLRVLDETWQWAQRCRTALRASGQVEAKHRDIFEHAADDLNGRQQARCADLLERREARHLRAGAGVWPPRRSSGSS